MVRRNSLFGNLDWISILIWLVLMAFGWMNIYSANIMEADHGIFDLDQRFGKQLIWIIASLVLAFMLLMLDAKFYIYFSYILYFILIGILLAVLIFGKEVNGARSWFVIGSLRLQPSEFAKPLTALALARLLSSHNFNLSKLSHVLQAAGIVALPALLILFQPDLGSVLIYAAFILVLFREGFSANIMLLLLTLAVLFILTLLLANWLILLIIALICMLVLMIPERSLLKGLLSILWLGLTFAALYGLNHLLDTGVSNYVLGLVSLLPVTLFIALRALRNRSYGPLKVVAGMLIAIVFTFSVDYAFNHVLKPHQQHRIYVTLGLEDDPQGIGYNVNQSLIAIGSGGFSGKGYLEGTQTKLHFVPEQSTDFIFCTVGEEWGFLGTAFVVLLFVGFLLRMLVLAERQRSVFSRIFGYGLISIIWIHFVINIGMTIGLLPVIGIPLPFFSYGGSSLWSFTIFLAIFLRLDANRLELLH